MRLVTLSVDAIDPNPNQPRQHFDAASLRDLADSIKANGQLSPINVRRRGQRYEIIAGERRWRAHQLAEIPTIHAVVMDDVDDERAFLLATLENCARVDMKPIEEAKAYAAIIALGRTAAEVAEMVGQPLFRVCWRLELLNLAPEFQDIDLPRNVARLLSRMDLDRQRVAMRRYIAGDFATVQEMERHCNHLIASAAQVVMFGAQDLDPFGSDEARRERARVNRSKIAIAWDRITKIASAFGPIDETSPADVADALDGDLDRYLREIRALEAHARRARIQLEKAKAIQKAGH